MLADTDAGSIITAAQSGASWGYRLLPLELLLIPVLYLVMELTVRLGATTGKGHAEAIRERFGPRWAAFSVGALLVSVTGALISEFAGIAAVGRFVGLAPALTVSGAAAFLLLVVYGSSYRRVELIALALGSFELVFLVAAILAHPRFGTVASSLWSHQPVGQRGYLTLMAANVGAVIMPWMIFYQQGAVVDKGLRERHIRIARIDTAVGAVLTQLIMAAILILTAATLFGHGQSSLSSVGEISNALSPYLGTVTSRVTLALGISGAGLLAAIVVSLAASWAVAEAFGARHSLNDNPHSAPLFYGIYTGCVAVGAGAVLASSSFVRVAVDVEVLNALLLPVVIGFLVALAVTTLPRPYRLLTSERVALGAVVVAVSVIGLGWAGLTFLPGSSATPPRDPPVVIGHQRSVGLAKGSLDPGLSLATWVADHARVGRIPVARVAPTVTPLRGPAAGANSAQ
ncbi:MAG: NRAMP family divalent metal transporter [Solirubrobacteraceae bacterium]